LMDADARIKRKMTKKVIAGEIPYIKLPPFQIVGTSRPFLAEPMSLVMRGRSRLDKKTRKEAVQSSLRVSLASKKDS